MERKAFFDGYIKIIDDLNKLMKFNNCELGQMNVCLNMIKESSESLYCLDEKSNASELNILFDELNVTVYIIGDYIKNFDVTKLENDEVQSETDEYTEFMAFCKSFFSLIFNVFIIVKSLEEDEEIELSSKIKNSFDDFVINNISQIIYKILSMFKADSDFINLFIDEYLDYIIIRLKENTFYKVIENDELAIILNNLRGDLLKSKEIIFDIKNRKFFVSTVNKLVRF